MRHEARVLVHDVGPEGHDLLALELDLPAGQSVEAAIPTLRLVPRVVEEERPHQAPKLARLLRVAETLLVLDERHDLFADLPEERLDLAASRRLRRRDLTVHLPELAVEAQRLRAFLFGELLRHQEREEETVFREDVRCEARV